MKTFQLLTLFVICTSLMQPALSLKCRGKLIDRGDTLSRVYTLCGKPTYQRADGYFNHWVYNQGRTKLVNHLTFQNGSLMRIEVGNRGFTDDYNPFPAMEEH